MKTYTVKAGDTLERISTITYGSPSQARLILSANPIASGGLIPGMVLVLPADPILEPVTPKVRGARENEVTILLDNKLFTFWVAMTIKRSIGRFDQFTLRSPFDHTQKVYRDTFRPMSFRRAQVFVGDELIYTGVNVGILPQAGIDGIVVSVTGYALAGVLNDCTMPSSSYPLDFFLYTMQEIAKDTAKPFGLVPVFTDEAKRKDNLPFTEAAMGTAQKILPFWTKLASQIGLVISNNAQGQPVFGTETNEKSIQLLELGKSPVQRVAPELNPQQYYSDVTAVASSFVGGGGEKFPANNTFLNDVVRPFTFGVGDLEATSEQDTRDFTTRGEDAAKAKLGRMFVNAIQYQVDVAGWRDVRGDLWAPNTRVRLLAPQAMVYAETEFLIKDVLLQRNPERDTAVLTLVLPGGFDARAPETLPWLE